MSKINPNFTAALWQQSSDSNLSSGVVKLAMLDNSYAPSDAHVFFSDISANVIGTPVTITGKDFTDGVFTGTCPDYDGTELNGQTVGTMYLYIEAAGGAGASRLFYYFDSASEAQLPFTGAGSDQPVTLPPIVLCDQDGSGNDVYPLFAKALYEQPANSSVAAGTLTCVGVTGSYVFSATDQFLSDIGGGELTGTPQVMDTKTYAAGLLDGIDSGAVGGDIVFVGGVTDCRGFLWYLDTGTPTTSRLVGVCRTVQALPGGGLTTAEDLPYNFPSGIFQLGSSF